MASVDLWERNYNRSKVRLRLELTFVHHSRKVGNVQLSLGLLQKVIAWRVYYYVWHANWRRTLCYSHVELCIITWEQQLVLKPRHLSMQWGTSAINSQHLILTWRLYVVNEAKKSARWRILQGYLWTGFSPSLCIEIATLISACWLAVAASLLNSYS